MGNFINTYKLFAGFLALVLVAGMTSPAFAATEHISNGGFETGTFEDWTIIEDGAGDWYINDGTLFLSVVGGTSSPISGSFDAATDQFFFSKNMLSEPFTVPIGLTSANVNWDDRIYNSQEFSDPNQEARVEIRNAAGDTVLAAIWSTDPGDDSIQVGPNARSFDITTILQSLEGQDVRLCFLEQDNLGNFNFIVDNISLTTETDKVIGGTVGSMDTATLLVAGAQANMGLWSLALVGIVGAAAAITYKVKSKKTEQ